MMWRDPRLFTAEFWSGIVRTLSVTGFTMITTYVMVTFVPLLASDRGFITLGAKLLIIVIPAVVVHIALSALFGLEEVKPVLSKLKQLVLKPVRIQ
jgi:hypothetical protein